MNYKKYIIICLCISAILISNCSDTETTINTPKAVGVHPAGFSNPTSAESHVAHLRSTNWDLFECRSCHAKDYSGGTANVSCKTSSCHVNSRGPEQCNTCHGNFNDTKYSAPPRAIGGETSTLSKSVGVHFTHVYDANLANNVSCYECHPRINSGTVGYVKTHINGLPAEIMFGTLATTKTNTDSSYSQDHTRAMFEPVPVYDSENATCSNTYCHGYFKNGNTDNVVTWTKDPSNTERIKCGTCHGDPVTGNPLPKGSHTQNPIALNCSYCHQGVVSEGTSNWQIIDPTKHINGKLNYQGTEKVL